MALIKNNNFVIFIIRDIINICCKRWYPYNQGNIWIDSFLNIYSYYFLGMFTIIGVAAYKSDW